MNLITPPPRRKPFAVNIDRLEDGPISPSRRLFGAGFHSLIRIIGARHPFGNDSGHSGGSAVDRRRRFDRSDPYR